MPNQTGRYVLAFEHLRHCQYLGAIERLERGGGLVGVTHAFVLHRGSQRHDLNEGCGVEGGE